MTGVWYIALRRVLHNRGLSAIMAMCIGVAILLPLATGILAGRYGRALVARADASPLVAGARGNRFDLTLASLYWRRSGMATISMAHYRAIAREFAGADAIGVPLHVRFTAQRVPIVATTPEYFTARHLRARDGTLPLMIGDAVLGSAAAARLGLDVGDSLFSDQIDAFDIAKPPALKMRVVGLLAPAGPEGSPDDDAVFTDIKTAWILEGLAHGHADAATGVAERMVLDRSGANVSLSEELIEYNEVKPSNLSSFHMHADESMLPVSAVLIFPGNDKAGTLIKSRINVSQDMNAVVPREVVDELLAIVVRVRTILDTFFVVLGLSTISMSGLIAMLSIRVRARETETLHRIGCSRWFVVQLHAVELLIVSLAGVLLAIAGTALVVWLMPGLVRVLQTGAPLA